MDRKDKALVVWQIADQHVHRQRATVRVRDHALDPGVAAGDHAAIHVQDGGRIGDRQEPLERRPDKQLRVATQGGQDEPVTVDDDGGIGGRLDERADERLVPGL